jgi:hypothetical protein
MGAEYRNAARRHLIQFIDEIGALGAKVFDDMAVMDDFMARSTPAQKPRGWARMTCMIDTLQGKKKNPSDDILIIGAIAKTIVLPGRDSRKA